MRSIPGAYQEPTESLPRVWQKSARSLPREFAKSLQIARRTHKNRQTLHFDQAGQRPAELLGAQPLLPHLFINSLLSLFSLIITLKK